ncbi:MAG: S41 family peptidase, partial [Bacteroidota bacterium]|nr:S41 family peptidase [Bacteroidota bacterium]
MKQTSYFMMLINLDGFSISIRIKQIVARIGDAHTTIGAPVNYIFPLYFLWMEDGLFVTGADQEHEQLIGSKVETINGVPVEQVLALLAPLISHENKQWLLKESTQLLRNPEVLKFIGVVSNIKVASFTFSCKDGKKETTEIPSFPAHKKLNTIYYDTHFNISLPLSQLKEMNSKNYAYQYLPNYNTVYFKYNVCRESEHQPFAEFCKEMFDLIRKENVAHIIIDLRTNPGGDWIYFNRSFLPKLATSRVKQNENVYILIGRGT